MICGCSRSLNLAGLDLDLFEKNYIFHANYVQVGGWFLSLFFDTNIPYRKE